jgi:hypothetical protein
VRMAAQTGAVCKAGLVGDHDRSFLKVVILDFRKSGLLCQWLLFLE